MRREGSGMRKRIAQGLGVFGVLLIVGAVVVWNTLLSPLANVGAAFQAKSYCSGIFVSGRTYEVVQSRDLTDPRLAIFKVDVDFEEKSATGSLFGFVQHKAIYRDGCGCTLVNGVSEAELRALPVPKQTPKPLDATAPWPKGNGPIQEAAAAIPDKAKLAEIFDWAFSEDGDEPLRGSRAAVVVYQGQLVAERYAEGMSSDTPLGAYSTTKSIVGALVGIRVKEGKLDIRGPAPVPEWKDPADPRHAITLDHLLRMSSGLEFDESYRDFNSDAIQMLYLLPDSGGFAASKPLAHAPDEVWYYSSGTTNIVSRAIRHSFDSDQDYLDFPYKALLHPIGMNQTTMETDATGTYVGSSYMYATARDMARFGLLCLNDGVWEGQRILPEGWIDYVRTPTPKAPREDRYGAHFWLNTGDDESPESRPWPSLPADTFSCMGFEGQHIFMIPSRDVVIVRMGQTRRSAAWSYEKFVKGVLDALPQRGGSESVELQS